jgi:hypothetical protein
MLSDRGSEFKNSLLNSVCALLGTRSIHITPVNPRANGLAENAMRTLKDMIAQHVNAKHSNWSEHLYAVQHIYNTTVNTSSGYTPFYLNTGRQCASPDTIYLAATAAKKTTKDVDLYAQELAQALSLAWRTLGGSTWTSKTEAYNARPSQPLEFVHYKIDQLIFIKRIPRRIYKDILDEEKYHLSSKLQARYSGPYRVTGKISDVVYEVEMHGKTKRTHAVNMKPAMVDLHVALEPLDPATEQQHLAADLRAEQQLQQQVILTPTDFPLAPRAPTERSEPPVPTVEPPMTPGTPTLNIEPPVPVPGPIIEPPLVPGTPTEPSVLILGPLPRPEQQQTRRVNEPRQQRERQRRVGPVPPPAPRVPKPAVVLFDLPQVVTIPNQLITSVPSVTTVTPPAVPTIAPVSAPEIQQLAPPIATQEVPTNDNIITLVAPTTNTTTTQVPSVNTNLTTQIPTTSMTTDVIINPTLPTNVAVTDNNTISNTTRHTHRRVPRVEPTPALQRTRGATQAVVTAAAPRTSTRTPVPSHKKLACHVCAIRECMMLRSTEFNAM